MTVLEQDSQIKKAQLKIFHLERVELKQKKVQSMAPSGCKTDGVLI